MTDPGRVEIAAEVLGDLAERDAPLGARTTYRVGGNAALLATVSDLDGLGRVAEAHRRSGLEVLVVGRGSNMLVADGGFGGIAVVLDPAEDAFGFVRIDGSRVHAGAAVALPTLARRTVEAGLTGFEWAVGVPGSLGGAVRMNAGGHGSDMAASLAEATLVDLRRVTSAGAAQREVWPPHRLDLGYRSSAVRATSVVLDATLQLTPGDADAGRHTLRAIVRWRREHQPGGQNAGSVFANPGAGVSAGHLVDAAGCKGLRVGSAEVSTKHANFIQADVDGSADDVWAVMAKVAAEVERSAGVVLRTEIRRIGFESRDHVEVEG